MDDNLTLNLLHMVMSLQPEKSVEQAIHEVKQIREELFTKPPKPRLVPDGLVHLN